MPKTNSETAARQRNRPPPGAPGAPGVGEQRIAVQRGQAIKVSNSTVVTICHKVGNYRAKAKVVARGMVDLTNDGREIGLLIDGFIEKLPGKQFTLDFWQQWKDQFVCKTGGAIELDELKWFVRLAKNMPKPAETLLEAFAARQMTFGAAGFELIGERPPGLAHEQPVPYNDFLSALSFKPLEKTIKKLELDPNYGPVESWSVERKEIVWHQVKPMYELLLKLKPGTE